MIRSITYAAIFLLSIDASADPLRVNFSLDQSGFHITHFFLIDGNFTYIKYNVDGFYLQDNDHGKEQPRYITGELSNRQTKGFGEELLKLGVRDWKHHYPSPKVEGSRTFCHSRWNLDLLISNTVVKSFGYCGAPDGFSEIGKLIESLVASESTNKKRNEMDGSDEPPIR